jgi:hypothetical protein
MNLAEFKCDSCETPNPKWLYRTKQFRAPLVENSKYIIAGWAACDECRALIDARDLEGISQRASLALADPAEPGDYDCYYRGSLKIYRSLFDHIIGPAEPFTAEDSAAIAAEDIDDSPVSCPIPAAGVGHPVPHVKHRT